MSKKKFFGLSAAMVTPFGRDGTVDVARLAAHARHVLAEGCDTITLFGTTGEGFSIALRDRKRMLDAVVEAGVESGRIYAGVSATAIDDAIDQARLALDHGARGLLLAPPFYFKGPDEDGLYAWFCKVIEGTGQSARGIILYHIPGQTAVPLSVELIGRLKEAFPGAIAGIKDSSGDWSTTKAFLTAHGELSVLVGDERHLVRAMALGAEGSICGLANLQPAMLRALIHEHRDDPRLVPLVDLIVSYPVLPAVKALVAHTHGDEGFVTMRPPLTDLAPRARAELTVAYDAILAGDKIRKSA